MACFGKNDYSVTLLNILRNEVFMKFFNTITLIIFSIFLFLAIGSCGDSEESLGCSKVENWQPFCWFWGALGVDVRTPGAQN